LPKIYENNDKDMSNFEASGSDVDLAKIRSGVKRYWGAYKEIARRAGVTTETVRCVLRGEWRSDVVVDKAVDYLHEQETFHADRRNRINQMVSEAEKLARVI
jgi:predicted transcriptional regulator